MSLLNRVIEEANSRKATITAPPAEFANRVGWVSGIPIGGATADNPAEATTSGAVNRSAWMDQLFQAYLVCPWAADCVDVIARAVTAGGVQAAPNSINLDNPIIPPQPPGVKKIMNLMQFINPNDNVRQLMRIIITDLLVFGDAYIEVVYVNGEPAALYHLDPRTMYILETEHGVVQGYKQMMETGREALFGPHEVIHIKNDAPGGGAYGVSPTQKVLYPITTWIFAHALVQETMKNGDPIRGWVDWPIALPDSEIRKFSQQYQIRNKGAKNIGNLIETKGGALLKELGINQITHWQDVKQQSRDEVISGFGVPPSKVGVVEAGNIGSGTGTSQDKAFRTEILGPTSELVMEQISFALLYTCYGVDDWHLEFGKVDWRDDEVIEQIRDMRLRNGSWVLNRYRSDIGEPPVNGGNDPILVDRQNMILWEDMNDLSKANVAAIKAKGAAGVPGTGAAPPPTAGPVNAPGPGSTGSPSAPGSGSSSEDYSAPWDPESTNALERKWAQAYHDRREMILRDYSDEVSNG